MQKKSAYISFSALRAENAEKIKLKNFRRFAAKITEEKALFFFALRAKSD